MTHTYGPWGGEGAVDDRPHKVEAPAPKGLFSRRWHLVVFLAVTVPLLIWLYTGPFPDSAAEDRASHQAVVEAEVVDAVTAIEKLREVGVTLEDAVREVDAIAAPEVVIEQVNDIHYRVTGEGVGSSLTSGGGRYSPKTEYYIYIYESSTGTYTGETEDR